MHGLSCDASSHKGLTPLMTSVIVWIVFLRRTSWSEDDEGRVSKGFRDDPKGNEIEREKKSTQKRLEEQQHLDLENQVRLKAPLYDTSELIYY